MGAPEGQCTDCHAGENPFIIHPNDPAFVAAIASVPRIFPDAWPTPIVPALFPGNPEPLDQLGPVSEGQLRCDTCHAQGGVGGRFPLPSTDHLRYCAEVLAPAVGEDPNIPYTMPANGLDGSQFGDHKGWLAAACDVAPGGGVVVPFVPPHVTILPPDVEPPYACSKYVHVTNAMYGATVKLYNNANVLLATGVFRDPHGGLVLKASSPFTVNQLLKVSQTVGATTSVKTQVSARDYTEDYMDGLPAPFISPHPLYQCASAIAVFNVPGVDLTVTKTPPVGPAKSYTLSTGAGHTWVAGLGSPPFAIGTRLKVRQKLCMETSADSPELPVGAAPAFLPELRFDPPQLTVGQPVVRFESIWQGSRVTLTETNGPTVVYNNASVPYNDWFVDVTTSLGGPVQATHDIVPIQQLCGVQSGDPDYPPPQPCNEETIVPAIAPPIAGDDFVLITYGVPGANTRVFDGVPTELGNGAGNVVGLSRELVAGEVIDIVATLGACSVNRAFSIVVSG